MRSRSISVCIRIVLILYTLLLVLVCCRSVCVVAMWGSHLVCILTAINSIDNKYEELKNNLMQQVCDHLQNEDITSICDALLDILFNGTFDYSKVLANNTAFTQKLLQRSLDKGNTQQFIMSEHLLNFYTKYLTELSVADFKEMVNKNNGFFIQVIHQSKSYGELLYNSLALYKKYVEIEGSRWSSTEMETFLI